VGASANPGKAGYYLLRNILDGGYRGEVYPVNPNGGRLLGCRSHSTIREVPKPIDLAFLVVSKPLVKPMLLERAERKVKAVAIVTAGFAESGGQGARDQRELQAIIQAGGMRALGPNSVGFINASRKLVGSFLPFRRWPEGPVAMAAQTGVFAGAYADELSTESTQRIGFSKSICFGNKIDVDEADFLNYAGEDWQTRVIALHLESLKRPREFLAAASRVKRAKPIVVLKTGRSEEGARVAASQSGSLASSDRVVRHSGSMPSFAQKASRI
jgi:acetyltransferase